MAVIFDVRASSVLAGVGFTGNRNFNEKDLREAIQPDKEKGKPGLASGLIINDKSLARARAELVKYYQEAFYPDTQVNWQTRSTANGAYKDVIFNINEGPRQAMAEIRFKGNRAFDSVQLRQLLETKEYGPCSRSSPPPAVSTARRWRTTFRPSSSTTATTATCAPALRT